MCSARGEVWDRTPEMARIARSAYKGSETGDERGGETEGRRGGRLTTLAGRDCLVMDHRLEKGGNNERLLQWYPPPVWLWHWIRLGGGVVWNPPPVEGPLRG